MYSDAAIAYGAQCGGGMDMSFDNGKVQLRTTNPEPPAARGCESDVLWNRQQRQVYVDGGSDAVVVAGGEDECRKG